MCGAWCCCFGAWCVAPGAVVLALGVWRLGAWCVAFGAVVLAPGAVALVPGVWRLVVLSWRLAFGRVQSFVTMQVVAFHKHRSWLDRYGRRVQPAQQQTKTTHTHSNTTTTKHNDTQQQTNNKQTITTIHAIITRGTQVSEYNCMGFL